MTAAFHVWCEDGSWHAASQDRMQGTVSGTAEIVLGTVEEWMGERPRNEREDRLIADIENAVRRYWSGDE